MNTLPTPALANISFVTPRLAIGGDLHWDEGIAVRQLEEMRALGVTHLVDLRIEWTDEELVARRAPEITYVHLGIDDAGQQIPADWFDVAVGHVLAAHDDPDAIVVTHCHMGINRGPSLGFASMLATGWDAINALECIRRARPIAYVAYAESALRWHHRRTGVAAPQRAAELRLLTTWRAEHDREVAGAIRRLRDRQDGVVED
jgi:dual specificity phosphatase 3